VSRLLIKRGIEHHLEIHDTEGLLASGVIEELVAAHKDGVLRTLVPISHSAAGIFVEHGAVVERIHVAPSGVDLSQFEGLAPFDPERLAAPRVLHAGSLAADRGEAVLQAVAARGICSVTIVGRVENEVDGAVMLAPVAPAEVPALYGECDLVLVPYQSDLPRALTMSPVKIFEAMAAGRPIIASSLPTIREVLRHESNALIVPPNDMAAWMSAIERLRGDPELAVRLANQAKMDAGQYSWEERAKGLSKAIGMHRQPV
jgi:glycosyltransferase involved in cell wall biosynthesis